MVLVGNSHGVSGRKMCRRWGKFRVAFAGKKAANLQSSKKVCFTLRWRRFAKKTHVIERVKSFSTSCVRPSVAVANKGLQESFTENVINNTVGGDCHVEGATPKESPYLEIVT